MLLQSNIFLISSVSSSNIDKLSDKYNLIVKKINYIKMNVEWPSRKTCLRMPRDPPVDADWAELNAIDYGSGEMEERKHT